MKAVAHDVVAAFDLGDVLDGKTQCLENAYKQGEHQQRQNETVNKRTGHQILRSVGDYPAQDAAFQAAERCTDAVFKFGTPALALMGQPLLVFVQGARALLPAYCSGQVAGGYVAP